MNCIDEIFIRADIQQIREFLLHGVEETNLDPRPYKGRIESANKDFFDRLHRNCPNQKDFEEITDPIYDYATAIQERCV